ncbi:phenylalanine--tRNA ligase subunit beta [Methylomonas methanica]|uniref:Phenylalanine--tRNA ligase beta subunit n=1 Tax=Methylomonas methanica (strain DSM 25384 / MC09) TaxID=857087 RepID=G0A2F2_METMM|nr:phenylalanine--tRNA ligase subunit beta [Methylomonas methanica]AEG00132.1 Phenylalanyl-tRNA synthetase beta chain [Methylomonas methanica MC09]
MQVSEAWLRELINPPVSTEQLVEQLTMAGLEVDAVQPVAAQFSGVVVGEVISTEQHPNADKLKVCKVNVGQAEALQIVCGASNVRPGLKIPAALIGAVLPGDFKIKESKLRGELSFGMLCSEKELGLAASSDGLMELPADAPVGQDIRDYLALNDNVIELGLTPNRADCLSVEGVAREVAVINKLAFQQQASVAVAVAHQETLEIKVETPDACPVYLGRLIKGINPSAVTPLWMQERLRRCGIRSLSPVVDVTNYVLLELGQPLHAFDAAKLSAPIVVRNSRAGESLSLLNDQTIELDGEALVIADQQQALALAGVMGGSTSAVSDETQDIFLECAFFSPRTIAGKARQFGLHTDSSHRFERGVDFTLQQRAIERATQLIVEIAGGSVGSVNAVISQAHYPARLPVKLRSQRIQKILGIRLTSDEVSNLFKGLGMQVAEYAEGWEITPPGWRFDIAIEADLLEEIGRIVGYNNLPGSNLLMRTELGKAPEASLTLERLQDCLVDRGYQEAITYSFVDEAMQTAVAPNDEFIRIQNPISSELAVMRTTLWCGLLTAAQYNLNRQQTRVRLFESGLRFLRRDGETKQQKMLAGLALGNVFAEQWGEKARDIDFFDVKADVEALLSLTAGGLSFKPAQHPALHPGQTAEIVDAGSHAVGLFGMLHPNLEKQLGFDSPVFLFEIAQDAILQRVVPKFTALSKFPSVRRDMALLVRQNISAEDLINCINSSREQAVREVSIFDIYQGKGIEEGFKSVALSLILQDFTQTLTDSEIDAIFRRLLEKMTAELNAKLRE